MPKRIFIKDGGLTSSRPTPSGYTVLGSNNGTPKKQIQSTISDLGGFTHYIGEEFGGGVVFSLWKNNGVETGLVVDTVNLSTNNTWCNIVNVYSGASSSWDGLTNSNLILTIPGHTTSAAKLCLDSNNGGFSDWYLPSIDELHLIRLNRFYINQTLSNIGGTLLPKGDDDPSAPLGWLWSSTEYVGFPSYAWYVDFYDGDTYDLSKNGTYKTVTRAIRKFTI